MSVDRFPNLGEGLARAGRNGLIWTNKPASCASRDDWGTSGWGERRPMRPVQHIGDECVKDPDRRASVHKVAVYITPARMGISVSVTGSICSDFSGACDWLCAPTATQRSSGQTNVV